MRRYLFVAIDRASRWVHMEIHGDQSDTSSINFLAKESTLRGYPKTYNHSIPQRALNHLTPIQALKE